MNQVTSRQCFDSPTCVCCMCRCCNHECFQQQLLKLPISMQNQLDSQNAVLQKRNENEELAYEASKQVPYSDLYKRTVYKRDFCEERDLLDNFPLEQKNLVGSLKTDVMWVKDSSYRDDFIPWAIEEQNLCRAKLYVPDHSLEKISGDVEISSMDAPKIVSDELCNYYCPPHCLGDKKEQPKINCLIDHKERFNLGPPTRKQEIKLENPHPFPKFSSYSLDYKKHQLSPRRKEAKPERKVVQQPLSSDTSYRTAFTYPPEVNGRPGKQEDQSSTLSVGHGPMFEQTTSMLDYTDPNVQAHKSTRPPKEVFRPPTCRMETVTTTRSSYPRWKVMLFKEKADVHKESSYEPSQGDIRRLVTTYQEDYDGLNLALCPGNLVEKCGLRALEPGYKYMGSENEHDFFLCNKNEIPFQTTNCSHTDYVKCNN